MCCKKQKEYSIKVTLGGKLLREVIESYLESFVHTCIVGFNSADILKDHNFGTLVLRGIYRDLSFDSINYLISITRGLSIPYIIKVSDISRNDLRHPYTFKRWSLNGKDHFDILSSIHLDQGSVQNLLSLIFDIIDKGISVLPLYINTEDISVIVGNCLSDPDNTVDILRNALSKHIPLFSVDPELPAFEII